jgi:hypothetical protein
MAPEIWNEEGYLNHFIVFIYYFLAAVRIGYLVVGSVAILYDVWKIKETVVVALLKGKIKTPPKEMQERYSEGLKNILSLLLSQVCSII